MTGRPQRESDLYLGGLLSQGIKSLEFTHVVTCQSGHLLDRKPRESIARAEPRGGQGQRVFLDRISIAKQSEG